MMSPTTHREHKGLLLQIGLSPCAPTYNRGMVQNVIFDRFELAQRHECSSKGVTCYANSTVQAACNLIPPVFLATEWAGGKTDQS